MFLRILALPVSKCHKEYNRQKRFQHSHISTFLGIGICNLRFEKAARWQDAVQLFQEIPTARLCPSLVSFNSLISCLEKAGQWQLAVLTLLGMADPNNDEPATAATAAASTVPCVPDLLTFNAAISSCEKGAQWQWAIQIFDMMCLCQLRIAPDAISFNALISSSTEQSSVLQIRFLLCCRLIQENREDSKTIITLAFSVWPLLVLFRDQPLEAHWRSVHNGRVLWPYFKPCRNWRCVQTPLASMPRSALMRKQDNGKGLAVFK